MVQNAPMHEINWETASEADIDAYLKKRSEETLTFIESLKAPLANLTEPQDGVYFDAIADEIEKAAPNADALYLGLRLFGRRNNELRKLPGQTGNNEG